ncbi:MAG: universal stress protein, partial [Planctomycetota bacterium]
MFQLQKILVPTDFSEGSRAAMNYACMLSKKMKAEIILLYVLESPYHLTTELLVAGPENKNVSILEYIRKGA